LDIHQIKDLLEKYRRGTCTEAESVLIEDWLSTIKNDQQNHFSDNFIDDQLSITKNRIDALIDVAPLINRKKHNGWLAVAASLLVIASLSIAIRAIYLKKQPVSQLANQTGVEKYTIDGWVHVQTKKGITDHIKLPDGSFITLNASSTLRYPVKFFNHKRPVYLDEGEALFDVAKDKTSPFTVYTIKFATTALGTAFNIRSYAKEHKVSISLIHGKIRVDDLHPASALNSSKILLPHQQVVLNKQSGQLIKNNFKDETPITSWKDGTLAFQDATMDEVVNSIENRFDVIIKNNSNRTNWSYTGVFKDEPLADVLKTVSLTEGITCTIIDKNNITFN
jgi:transmembrane sensor